MERLLTTDEVAEYLRVDVVTIRRLISRGELTAYRIGGEYRFTQSDLEEYLQRQRVSAGTGDGSGTFASTPREGVRKGLQEKHTTPFDPVSDRFHKFTEQARRVLRLSQEEAQRFQHHYIGTEHLLLGLLREDAGVAAQVLRNLNVELKQVCEAVDSIIGRGGRIVSGEVGLTPRAKKVLELSVEEAHRLDQHYAGTEHLLLGLIREGEGIAAEVLASQGVELDQARAETLRALRQLQESETDTVPPLPAEAAILLAEGEPGLTCTHCGAHCPNYFRHCFNCGQPLKPQ
jgi:excisionase family DNA binding protein